MTEQPNDNPNYLLNASSERENAGRFPKGYRARDLFGEFRKRQDALLEKLLVQLAPRDAVEEVIIEQFAGTIAVLEIARRDMEVKGMVTKRGSLRPSWNAYLTAMSRFTELLGHIRKPNDSESLAQYLKTKKRKKDD